MLINLTITPLTLPANTISNAIHLRSIVSIETGGLGKIIHAIILPPIIDPTVNKVLDQIITLSLSLTLPRGDCKLETTTLIYVRRTEYIEDKPTLIPINKIVNHPSQLPTSNSTKRSLE